MWAETIRPAGQPGRRQSHPAGGTSRQTLRRPQLEALEDRLNPSFSLNFFPIAHVAVNPQPLPPFPQPPSVAIEIMSMPNLPALSAGTSTQEGHVAGVLSKQIALQPGAPTTSAAPANYLLELVYNLNAGVTQTAVPPSSFADGSVRDTINLAGTFAATLAPVAPTAGATWVLHGNLTENGTLTGEISRPDPATGVEQVVVNFSFHSIDILSMGPSGSALDSWQEQLQTQSTGSGISFGVDNPTTLVAPTLTQASQGSDFIWFERDQVTATLTQASPDTVPPPVLQINAAFQPWGHATVSMLRPATAFTPELDTGTVQYTDSGLETILMPDGSVQEVNQTAKDSGTFIIAVLVG
jgi:hypothetical protein